MRLAISLLVVGLFVTVAPAQEAPVCAADSAAPVVQAIEPGENRAEQISDQKTDEHGNSKLPRFSTLLGLGIAAAAALYARGQYRAAMLSAEAALAGSRAWILIHGEVIAERADPNPVAPGGDIVWLRAKYALKNVGKTPAVVHEVKSWFEFSAVGEAKPRRVTFDEEMRWYEVMEPDKVFSKIEDTKLALTANTGMSASRFEALDGVLKGTPTVFVFIVIRYEDIFGWIHETGRCFRLFCDDDGFAFVPEPGPDLNHTDSVPPRRKKWLWSLG